MHRSGTSALTGALARLGLALPSPPDLVTGRYDNPVHNESRALTDLDDAVLGALGGTWSAPPELAPGWERSPGVLEVARRAPAAARRAFPGDGPVVWKDPRQCLLLPLWWSLLPPPTAAVFLWRAPLAVARSLRARQGFTVSLGLALWERYTRHALAGLAGRPAYVMRYETLVTEPASSLGAVGDWLRTTAAVPVAADREAIAAAASSVSGSLAHSTGDGELPEVLDRAVATLSALDGAHDALAGAPGADAPSWMADVIDERRHYEDLYARYMRYVRWRRRIPLLGRAVRREPG
jgi:hypothetical protein